MDRRLLFAQHLLDARRFAEAERSLRDFLGEHPDDAEGLGMLAQARLHQDDNLGAEQLARRVIGVRPDEPGGYVVLAQALAGRRQLREAEEVAQRVIELVPVDPVGFGLLARVHASAKRWKEALAAADRGLELDPADEFCTALRGHALNKLGRHREAAQAGLDQLQRAPEDAYAHLSQGVTCLHAGQHRSAREHFLEALRLDPALEPARDGLREALRASHWFYRPVLGYFLWMERLTTGRQALVLVGGYVMFRVARGFTAGNSPLAWLAMLAVAVYILFALLTFLGRPVANAALCLSSDGRQALDRRERIEGLAITAALATAVGLGGWGWVGGHPAAPEAMVHGLLVLLGCIVFAQAGNASAQVRRPMYRFAAGFAAVGVVLMVFWHGLAVDLRAFDEWRAEPLAIREQIDALGVPGLEAALEETRGLPLEEGTEILARRFQDLEPAELQKFQALLQQLEAWGRNQTDLAAMTALQEDVTARRESFQTWMLLYALAAFWGAQILANVLASRAERRG